MVGKNKSIRAIRTKRYFIEATEQLMKSGGIENVTIRKVSDIAGYNSATLYNYFDSLEHLILFASLRFFKPYLRELSMVSNAELNPVERYVKTFRLFAFHSFSNPSIFYNFFYGKYNKYIGEILEEYYIMYPDELTPNLETAYNMILAGNIFVREKNITEPIYKSGIITKEDHERLVEMAIWSHEYLLNQMCQPDNEISVEEQCNKYEVMMKYLLKKMVVPGTPEIPILNE